MKIKTSGMRLKFETAEVGVQSCVSETKYKRGGNEKMKIKAWCI